MLPGSRSSTRHFDTLAMWVLRYCVLAASVFGTSLSAAAAELAA